MKHHRRPFPFPFGAFLLLGLFAAWAADANGDGRSLNLSGRDWWILADTDGNGARRGMPSAEVSTPGWIPAAVPGNIQADLEAAFRLKPLWYGAGDPRMAEAARKDWWYRKDFVVPASFKGRRVTLVFDGVDHACNVWLNGKKLGTHAGMFKRFQFDVGDLVRPGEENQLAVRILRMPPELDEVVLSSDAPGGANVGKAVHATRKVLRELKSPANNAWDWSVAVYTLGIWKGVRLEATGPARIEWTRVQTIFNQDYSKAQVHATFDVDSLARMTAEARVRITGNGADVVKGVDVVLKEGRNEIDVKIPLEHPELWWPNGQGEQPLYELHCGLTAFESGALSDSRTVRFGVREIRWEQVPGAPEDFINPLKLVVNGRPVRQMGSNMLPPDALFGRISQRGCRALQLAHEAGINCLRLWGGGVILPEEMLDLADELGIMMLAEFPLANCLPEDDPVFLANLEETARNILAQTRNHPCIVEWTGGNEMLWANGTDHPALRLLERLVREEDGRVFRATEPAQGSGAHGTYTYVYHTEPAPYLSWLGAGNNNLYRRYNACSQMRISEFGTNSPANIEVWHREIPPSSQWPLKDTDPVLVRKNVFSGAMLRQNWLHLEIIERLFGKAESLDRVVEAGQFLGAEGLRYAMDALRRKGPALGGGFMSWNYNEPWPNGAGSYMVDYDGRPLMNYDFVRQALAPMSLSVKVDSLLYAPESGVQAELFLTSDAPCAAENLQWQWLARDRRGRVLDRGKGTAAIRPQEVKSLASISVKPPEETALGPVFLELRLEDDRGKLLGERLHLFGLQGVGAPLAGLLKNGGTDSDDDLSVLAAIERPRSRRNLAFVGNGAKPATASSARPEPIHQPKGLNDGKYGNDSSWIGATSGAWFQIDLGKTVRLGRFKLGRDRTGRLSDRAFDALKIEVSADGHSWKTVFDERGISSREGFSPARSMTIDVAPVEARFVKAIVDPKDVDPKGTAAIGVPCIDEFEIYEPSEGAPASLPRIAFCDSERAEVWRPVRRTTLSVVAVPRIEGESEVLALTVKNQGPMTALFCEPHPLIDYRTDLFVENNHCHIPPGESRTITIRAGRAARRGLTLAQTGWRLSCWNADDVVIRPSGGVLLALGRRDRMCREFQYYSDPRGAVNASAKETEGPLPDPAGVPFLLGAGQSRSFVFSLTETQASRPARLRIHASDRAAEKPTKVVATLRDRAMEGQFSPGLGIQREEPAHLALPAVVEIPIAPEALRAGTNRLEVRVAGDGWFTWDAMDLRQ